MVCTTIFFIVSRYHHDVLTGQLPGPTFALKTMKVNLAFFKLFQYVYLSHDNLQILHKKYIRKNISVTLYSMKHVSLNLEMWIRIRCRIRIQSKINLLVKFFLDRSSSVFRDPDPNSNFFIHFQS